MSTEDLNYLVNTGEAYDRLSPRDETLEQAKFDAYEAYESMDSHARYMVRVMSQRLRLPIREFLVMSKSMQDWKRIGAMIDDGRAFN